VIFSKTCALIELIRKKRDGFALSQTEINRLIAGYVSGAIPDYQMSAWLMAVYFKGLNDEETAWLTDAMMHSGELIDLTSIPGVKVDKHSTGGVGDKTTLVLAPLVAAAGVPVAKMSGRGLGHTGGTLDKLESIPGFRVDLSREAFLHNVATVGVAVCAQSDKLVPADKMMYALRDVTATVDNISLIASSVMSKKLACGADAIVIDLKMGEGAFIKNLQDAEKLAGIMKSTANSMGRSLVAVVTNMDRPLGRAVGNALEVAEAITTLQGTGPEDLTSLCIELGSYMLLLGKKAATIAEAREILHGLLDSGVAFKTFEAMVRAQGGNTDVLHNLSLLPRSRAMKDWVSTQTGYIHHIKAYEVGMASLKLGAGRETKASTIDHGAGISFIVTEGTYIKPGDPLATLYAENEALIEEGIQWLNKSLVVRDTPPEKHPLIIKVIQ